MADVKEINTLTELNQFITDQTAERVLVEKNKYVGEVNQATSDARNAQQSYLEYMSGAKAVPAGVPGDQRNTVVDPSYMLPQGTVNKAVEEGLPIGIILIIGVGIYFYFFKK